MTDRDHTSGPITKAVAAANSVWTGPVQDPANAAGSADMQVVCPGMSRRPENELVPRKRDPTAAIIVVVARRRGGNDVTTNMADKKLPLSRRALDGTRLGRRLSGGSSLGELPRFLFIKPRSPSLGRLFAHSWAT
ncbi:hypothetical protein IAQ61_005177 [Plenodomus lingam]|uniref:uncharacterized protein n=1 Tax=Leptosphaeria maculans TaxID=5022 RepID=UPI00332302BE|nr:hypothetical protein IAQ61_005177 [Plenodomus lingam]